MDIDLAPFHQPVVADHDTRHRRQEDDICAHEVKEADRGRQDFPRDESPRSNNGSNDRSTGQVEVFRTQRYQVIGGRDDVASEVHGQHGEEPYQAAEECCSSTSRRSLPLRDNFQGIPDWSSINNLGGGSTDDPEHVCQQF